MDGKLLRGNIRGEGILGKLKGFLLKADQGDKTSRAGNKKLNR